MPESDEKPFTAYLRDVDAMLVGMSPQQRAEIQRELLAHLADAAAESDESSDDAQVQERVIAALGPGQELGLALYEVHQGGRAFSKRLFDLCVALIFLVLLAPLLLLISLLVKLDSRGPLLYKERRIGRNGRRFTLYKFRSMFVNCEQLPVDARVTRVGRLLRKTSLDELPQLFNVLRGDMSIIGPRPVLPGDTCLAIPQWRCMLVLRPGLTGPAVCQRVPRDDIQRQLEAGLHYIGKQSLLYDLRVLGKTLTMLFHR